MIMNNEKLNLKIFDLYIKMSESLSLQEKALMVNHFLDKGLEVCADIQSSIYLHDSIDLDNSFDVNYL